MNRMWILLLLEQSLHYGFSQLASSNVAYLAFLEALGGPSWIAPKGDSIIWLGDSMPTSKSVSWRGVTGRNGLPDLNPSGVLLLDFSPKFKKSERTPKNRFKEEPLCEIAWFNLHTRLILDVFSAAILFPASPSSCFCKSLHIWKHCQQGVSTRDHCCIRWVRGNLFWLWC